MKIYLEKLGFILLISGLVWLQVSNCGFASDWQRVYLATYPRSGNHWLRFLIEEATDMATSSVYRDIDAGGGYPHLPMPFPWGGYCCYRGYTGTRRYPTENDIIVVKTHFPALAKSQYDLASHLKVIRIVRHPVDSCYSHYAYAHDNAPGPVPHHCVVKFITAWRRFQEYYNCAPNVATFFYEDLLQSPQAVFAEVLDTIGYTVPYSKVEQAIAKYPPKGNLLKHIKQFRREDLILIAYELGDLMEQFGYSIPVAETP